MNERDLELALEAGFDGREDWPLTLQAFANLIRADEREACAELCDGWDVLPGGHEYTPQQLSKNLTKTIASFIRARGAK